MFDGAVRSSDEYTLSMCGDRTSHTQNLLRDPSRPRKHLSPQTVCVSSVDYSEEIIQILYYDAKLAALPSPTQEISRTLREGLRHPGALAFFCRSRASQIRPNRRIAQAEPAPFSYSPPGRNHLFVPGTRSPLLEPPCDQPSEQLFLSSLMPRSRPLHSSLIPSSPSLIPPGPFPCRPRQHP